MTEFGCFQISPPKFGSISPVSKLTRVNFPDPLGPRKTAGPSHMALSAPKRHEVEGVAVDRLGSSFEVKGRRNSNNGRSDGRHF